MFGGNWFAYLREKSVIAWTYCWPRNTSSSSFSRWAACFQTGMATVIMTAMMPRATSRAAMAYPPSRRWVPFRAAIDGKAGSGGTSLRSRDVFLA